MNKLGATPLLRVLLVEDNQDHAEMIKRSFRKGEHPTVVDWVEDGQAALDYLASGKYGELGGQALPSLILLDIKMPRLDGLEVLQRIKSDPLLKLIPVVMLTTTDREEEVLRCYELGANGYVTKPVAAHDFFRKMELIQIFWAQVNQPASIRRFLGNPNAGQALRQE